jgi:hypothetical protein
MELGRNILRRSRMGCMFDFYNSRCCVFYLRDFEVFLAGLH